MILSFLSSMLQYCLVFSPIYLVIRYIMIRKSSFSMKRETLYYLFFLYCVSIFSQTILPSLSFLLGHEQAIERSNFTPFQTIQLYVEQLGGPTHTIALYNLVGNIVLFIPFGFFIPLIWSRLRRHYKMVVIALMIPLFIETTQHFIGRSVDVDDVLLNTMAILLGYVLFILGHFLCEKLNYRLSKS